MQKRQKNAPRKAKIPSGISSIDLATFGGLQAGSFVVVFGDSSTPKAEFGYTTAFGNATIKRGIFPKPEGENVAPPENIWYLPLAKTRDDVIRDVRISFSDDFFEVFSKEVAFREFISDPHASSLAMLWKLAMLRKPGEDLEKTEVLLKGGEKTASSIETVRSIVEFLDREGRNSLIIIDSLDDLVLALPGGGENRLLADLRSMQSYNKNRWNSLIFSHLTMGVFPKRVEKSILSLADGVFILNEAGAGGSGVGDLNCKKFTSEELLNSRFKYHVAPSGFEAKKTELIFPLRSFSSRP